MKELILEFKNEYKEVYTVKEENKKGEKIIIEISKCNYKEGNKNKNSLPNLWVKHGYTDHLYNTALWIDCEVTDKDGNRYRKYEPTTKKENKRNVINFEYLFENTEENKEKLLKETLKRFKEAK